MRRKKETQKSYIKQGITRNTWKKPKSTEVKSILKSVKIEPFAK